MAGSPKAGRQAAFLFHTPHHKHTHTHTYIYIQMYTYIYSHLSVQIHPQLCTHHEGRIRGPQSLEAVTAGAVSYLDISGRERLLSAGRRGREAEPGRRDALRTRLRINGPGGPGYHGGSARIAGLAQSRWHVAGLAPPPVAPRTVSVLEAAPAACDKVCRANLT